MKILGVLILALFSSEAASQAATVLTVKVPYTLTFTWAPVTHYMDGRPLPSPPWYKLYDLNNREFPNLIKWVPKGQLSTTLLISTPGTYCFMVSAEIYDGTTNGNESVKSMPPVCVAAQ